MEREGSTLTAQGDAIPVYLHAIRVENAKKDARIRSLEAGIAAACVASAQADAVGEENRELKTEVEQLKAAAQASEARAQALEAKLCGASKELATAKRKSREREARLSNVHLELVAAKAKAGARMEELGRLRTEMAATLKAKEAELGQVCEELAATKRELALLSQAPPDLEALRIESEIDISTHQHIDGNQYVNDGGDGERDIGNQDNGYSHDDNGTYVVLDEGLESNDDNVVGDNPEQREINSNEEQDEHVSSQQLKRPPLRPAQEFTTPSPRKRQKGGKEYEGLTISPTHKDRLLSEDAAVSLIVDLEKCQPWKKVYDKSPTFSHTFEYEWLEHEAKMCVLAVQIFKSKFRRELWERLHWINFPSGGNLLALATKARATCHQTAETQWKELQERLNKAITDGLFSKEIWTEPFLWAWRAEPLLLPSTCTTVSEIDDIDKQEPERCFFVDCIDQHPFYETGNWVPKHKFPVWKFHV